MVSALITPLLVALVVSGVLANARETDSVEATGERQAQAYAFAGFRLVGGAVIAEEAFADLFDAFADRPITFDDLLSLAQAVEDRYHQAGYTLAFAYLPEQEVDDGIVTIAVIPGRYGDLQFENLSRVREGVARRALRGIMPADPIHTPTLDRRIAVLDGLPGIAAWSAFAEGENLGESDLIVRIEDSDLWEGSVRIDAALAQGVLSHSLTASAKALNPFGLGDEATLSLSTNGQNTAGLRANYRLPFGASLSYTLDGMASINRYELDGAFAGLGGGGTDVLRLGVVRTPVGSGASRLTRQLALERRSSFDELLGIRSSSRFHTLQFTLDWERDARGPQLALENARMDLIVGDLALAAGQRVIDAATARTEGVYGVVRAEGEWTRPVHAGRLTANLSGQWATKNLPSSEKFSLGGSQGVRALSGGRSLGDQGWLLRVEYAFAPMDAGDPPGRVQYVPFIDAGGITYNKRPWDPTGAGGRVLYGVGLRLNWVVSETLNLRVHQAWTLQDSAGITASGQPGPLAVNLSYDF